MSKLLVFGDSISWGAFDSQGAGWVERLKAYFLKDYKKNGFGVYNFSISGNNTRGVLKFLESDIKRMDAIESDEYIILFSIGSNDAAYLNGKKYVVPLDEFKENIKKLIVFSRKHSKKIIFTGLMKIDERLTLPWDKVNFWENSDIKKYDEIIQNLCSEENIEFIPLIDLINNDLLSDGLHPNTDGHKLIFDHVLKYLNKL